MLLKYSTSSIVLRVEISAVNLKRIFVKKEKQTREHPIRSTTSIHNKNNKIPVSSVSLPWIIVMIFTIAKDCTERLSAVRASEKNRECYSLVPRRSRLGQSWTLP